MIGAARGAHGLGRSRGARGAGGLRPLRRRPLRRGVLYYMISYCIMLSYYIYVLSIMLLHDVIM